MAKKNALGVSLRARIPGTAPCKLRGPPFALRRAAMNAVTQHSAVTSWRPSILARCHPISPKPAATLKSVFRLNMLRRVILHKGHTLFAHIPTNG